MTLRTFLVTTALALSLAPQALADTETTDLALAATDCIAGPFWLGYTPGAASGCNLDPFGGWTGSAADGEFSATDGLPLTLDTARAIHVEIQSSTYLGLPKGDAIGDETVAITLSGKLQSGKTVSLGSASKTTPAADRIMTDASTVTFDLPLTAAQAGVYKSLSLTTNIAGAVGGGYIDMDGSSLVSLPIIDGTAPVIPDG